jgi:imidazolonepropionase-like amidohydrolase
VIRSRARLVAVSLLLLVPAVDAQQAASDTSGVFIIHKIGNPVGRETWHVARDASGGRRLASRFSFSDRGTPVSLEAELVYGPGGRPAQFTLRGRTSRWSAADLGVSVVGDSAEVRQDSTRAKVALDGAFPAHGYAPMAMQQAVMHEWLARGRPATMKLLPAATLAITPRGTDTIALPSGRAMLQRVSVAGLIWGRETLWLDADGDLVAVATIDAEFDPVQAVREGDESAVGTFVKLAATDAIAALAELDASPAAAVSGDTLLALVGGTLIDGTGAAPVRDATIVIRGNRIVEVGPRSKVRVPRGARIVTTRGATMLPGLWDMHTHYAQAEWGPIYLAAGVTTVRDVGNQFDFLLGAREAIASGRGIGPRLLAAGIIDGDGPNAIGLARAGTPEQGVEWVRRYHAAGFEQIKIYSSVTAETLRAITAEAHALGMTVTGHVPRGLDAYQGVAAGMDQINHVHFVQRMMRAAGDSAPLSMDDADARRALAFLREHGTIIDPTIALYELNAHPIGQPVSAFEPGADKVAPELRQSLSHTGVDSAQAAGAQAQFRTRLAIIGALHRAGVPIVAGTDLAVPGHSLHRELELYVEAGFTPMEAIQSATLLAARAMGLERESGTIRPGLRADVLVVNGDPLQRISDTRKVRIVIANGRSFEPAPLWRSVGFMP